jgi:hypothetical protein
MLGLQGRATVPVFLYRNSNKGSLSAFADIGISHVERQ